MNSTAAAVAIDALVQLLKGAIQITSLIQKARDEGRDISAAELDVLSQNAEYALVTLKSTIASTTIKG